MSYDMQTPTDPNAEPSSSRTKPRSLRPHLFENEIASSRPFQEGRIKPSDLLTDEDYKRMRIEAAKRAFVGGIAASGMTSEAVRENSQADSHAAFAVRKVWPKLTHAQLGMVFMTSAVLGIWATTASYLQSEMRVVYRKAEDMSRAQIAARGLGPSDTAVNGEPVLRDPFAVDGSASSIRL
ncbi:hypothetical protein BD324DRAFT_614629 [Kockovaella imperatae]|uniref:Uncharacterized protein n=1 Tax=Kockovaella imperatae TaxID=4999 RepID=A0A1Y1UNW4_9TREE|nr:hypothetical protein BD324DRAFT_614629 [Kockovaella imperatae]ORX39692.1 hypothetical protein BD324DRAFT_614629 [Kockovaella imperatae]